MSRKPQCFLGRFRRNKTGMAATEFALITPLMLSLYFGVTELSDGLMCESKVTVLASTAADLVAQDSQITNAEMTEIFNALEEVMYPYSSASTQVVVSSLIYVNATSAKVAWSDAKNSSPRAVDSTVTIPSGLISAGGSVIFAEVKHNYTSPAGELIYGTIQMSETFYLKPRRTTAIARVAS
jgi:Flp pilus assembly protein TadG